MLPLLSAPILAAQRSASPARLTPQAIFQRYGSSVVRVVATLANGSMATGTGFFSSLNPLDGAIRGATAARPLSLTLATCAHVVEGAVASEVRSSDRARWRVMTVRRDKAADVALLDLIGAPRPSFAYSRFAEVQPGQEVVVIGNPLGFLTNSVTTGVVSAKRKSDGVPLVQISAPISPGSSGCPVLDVYGRLVGMASFTYTKGQSLNMAVAVDQLLAEKAGFSYKTVAEIADESRLVTSATAERSSSSLAVAELLDRLDAAMVDCRYSELSNEERLARAEDLRAWSDRFFDEHKDAFYAFGGSKDGGRELVETARALAGSFLAASRAAVRLDAPQDLRTSEGVDKNLKEVLGRDEQFRKVHEDWQAILRHYRRRATPAF